MWVKFASIQNFDLKLYNLAVASYMWATYFGCHCLSQSHFFCKIKIIAYCWYISHVIVIFYLKLNRSLVNYFFFKNCTLKCCCLAINFEMMYIDHVKLDIHVKISVSYTFYDIVRSAVIKFSVIYLPAVRFFGNKFNFQCCLLVSAINAKKLRRLKFPFHHSSNDLVSA